MKSIDNIVDSLGKYTGMTAKDLTEAEEDIQEDLADELIERIMEIVEAESTTEYDENEDGKFTTIVVDTPNTREIIRDMILDEYRLEKQ